MLIGDQLHRMGDWPRDTKLQARMHARTHARIHAHMGLQIFRKLPTVEPSAVDRALQDTVGKPRQVACTHAQTYSCTHARTHMG